MSDQKIRVLVIDDSPTDQKALSYLLSKDLNCQVETANDGLEGLDKLSHERFSMVFLDMMLPVMNGDEVLQEIRGCAETANTPVVIISANADPMTVKSVLGMGVYDYILKPYVKDTVVKRLASTFDRLRAETEESPMAEHLAGNGRPILMIADADNHFRHFVATTLASKFNVIQASSGALAVSLALKHRPELLLAGPKQGILSREKLILKLRATKKSQGIKIYAVDANETQEAGFDPKLFDGAVVRSHVPEVFLKSIETIAAPSGPREIQPTAMVDQLKLALVSATEQVFGMLMSAEVTQTANPVATAPDADTVLATIALNGFAEQKRLTLSFNCDPSCADAVAKKMQHDDQVAPSKELVHSSLAELMNITAGRIKNAFDEQGRTYLPGLPRVEERPASGLSFAGATLVHFAGPGSIRFSIAMTEAACSTQKVKRTELKEGLVLGQEISIENAEPLPKGSQLSAENLTVLQNQGPDEVEVFEAV